MADGAMHEPSCWDRQSANTALRRISCSLQELVSTRSALSRLKSEAGMLSESQTISESPIVQLGDILHAQLDRLFFLEFSSERSDDCSLPISFLVGYPHV